MSASPVDKKRRWMESSSESNILSNDTSPSSSTISRPPLKKRFTANGKISITSPSPIPPPLPPSSSTTTTTTATTLNDYISSKPTVSQDDSLPVDYDQLPKDVLMKRMRSAKEEVNSLESQIVDIERQCKDFEVYRSIIRIQWNMLQNDILVFSRALVDVDNNSVQDIPNDDMDNDRLGQELHKSRTTIHEIGVRILDYIHHWIKRSDQLNIQQQESQSSQVHQWVRDEIQQLRKSYEQSRILSKEMERRYQSLLEQSNHLLNQIRSKEQQLDQAEEGLYEYTEKLAQAEKRHDRLESKAVTSLLLSSGLVGEQQEDYQHDSSIIASSTNDNIQSTTDTTHVPTTTTTATATTISTTTTQSGEIAQPETGAQSEACKLQVAEQQLIVDARTKELEDLKGERQSLLDDMDRVQNEFSMLSNEKLMATEYYKTLELSLEHYRSREHYLVEMKSQLLDELHQVEKDRKIFDEDMDAEKKLQRQTMDSETKSLEVALKRIKKQRDEFQSVVNDYMDRKEREKQKQDQALKDIDYEADHILRVEKELSSLRTLIKSCEQGDGENPLNEIVTAYEKDYTRLNNAKDIVNHLEQKINSNSTATTIDKSILSSNDINVLQQKLSYWMDDNNNNNHSDIYKKIKLLMKKVDQQTLKSNQLQLLVDFFQKNEAQLMTQIDRAGAIFTQLEEQSSKPVFDLSHLNEQKNKLEAEKMKYGHTFANLKMIKDKKMEEVVGLRRTTEQQVQTIREQESEVKDLETEIHDKENECRRLVQTLEDRRIDVEDLQHQCGELRIQLEHSDQILLELQGMVKEKTRALDEEKQLQKKVEEEYNKMQRKWKMTTQGESPAEDELEQECNNFRMLLKCSACQDRVRKRLLSRCMHTFCKECIDKRLETRQRRCPTCGDPFGVGDVRQFFL